MRFKYTLDVTNVDYVISFQITDKEVSRWPPKARANFHAMRKKMEEIYGETPTKMYVNVKTYANLLDGKDLDYPCTPTWQK